MSENKTLGRLEEKRAKLKNAYKEANDDSRFRNLSFCAAGNLKKGARNYRIRHRDKICRLIDEITICERAIKIVKGEPFTLDEMDGCRSEIMNRYEEYNVITVLGYLSLSLPKAYYSHFGESIKQC